MILSQLKQNIITKLENTQNTLTKIDLLHNFTNLYSQLKDLPNPKLTIKTEILLHTKQNNVAITPTIISKQKKLQTETITQPVIPIITTPQPQIKPQLPQSKKITIPTTNNPNIKFNLKSYTNLIQHKHITLPQILKTIKIH